MSSGSLILNRSLQCPEVTTAHSAFKQMRTGAIVLGVLGAVPGLRNHLVDPWDIPDYANNMGVSVIVGHMTATALIGLQSESLNKEKRIRSISYAAIGAFLTTGLINSFVETKYGSKLFDEEGVASGLDTAWGTFAGSFSGWNNARQRVKNASPR